MKDFMNVSSRIFVIIVVAGALLMSSTSVFAHVVVKPNEVKPSTYQTFTIGVPNEKESSTTSVKLIIPEGVRSVMPNVKPGWKISVVKDGESEAAKVTEINWTGGTVPVGQREEFLFSAQTPANESTIYWKAYQTYSDGTVVSWDQEAGSDSHGQAAEPNKGPASQTKVANVVVPGEKITVPSNQNEAKQALGVSIVAIALAALSLGMQFFRHTKNK